MNPKLKKFLGRIAMIMTAGLLAVTPALAVEYIDVDMSYYGGSSGPVDEVWSQEFVPSASNISAVSVYLVNDTSGTVNVQILDALCGTVIAHGSGTGGPGWVKCDLVGVQALVPGQVYVIAVLTTAAWLGASSNHYPGVGLWVPCTEPLGDFDLTCLTWTDEEAVPNTDSTWGSVKSLFR